MEAKFKTKDEQKHTYKELKEENEVKNSPWILRSLEIIVQFFQWSLSWHSTEKTIGRHQADSTLHCHLEKRAKLGVHINLGYGQKWLF